MTPTEYTRALGARLLSEANDIKRTPDRLAQEMGLPADHIQAAIAGRLNPEEYHALFQAVSQRYPIAFCRLWMESADTECGVLHMTAEESMASRRTSDAVRYAVIGGSGIYEIEGMKVLRKFYPTTPFGKPSDPIVIGSYHGIPCAFLPRHGKGHRPSRHAHQRRLECGLGSFCFSWRHRHSPALSKLQSVRPRQ